eukprot:188623-Pyramimonas_sp.AAC.1
MSLTLADADAANISRSRRVGVRHMLWDAAGVGQVRCGARAPTCDGGCGSWPGQLWRSSNDMLREGFGEVARPAVRPPSSSSSPAPGLCFPTRPRVFCLSVGKPLPRRIIAWAAGPRLRGSISPKAPEQKNWIHEASTPKKLIQKTRKLDP